MACVLGVAVLVTRAPVQAQSNAPALGATMSCEPASEPGRVKCSVEARVTDGRSVAWADVVLVELPELATALKGRLGPSDVMARDASSVRWAFGLVAKKSGEGPVKARVRASVCEAGDAGPLRCAPVSVDVRALVQVR